MRPGLIYLEIESASVVLHLGSAALCETGVFRQIPDPAQYEITPGRRAGTPQGANWQQRNRLTFHHWTVGFEFCARLEVSICTVGIYTHRKFIMDHHKPHTFMDLVLEKIEVDADFLQKTHFDYGVKSKKTISKIISRRKKKVIQNEENNAKTMKKIPRQHSHSGILHDINLT